MTARRPLTVSSLIALLAACTSTPVHFHTLMAAPVDPNVARRASSMYYVNVESVRVPAQVDRIEMVVRKNTDEMELLNNELWIASLGEEIQTAMAFEINRALNSADASGIAGTPTELTLRLVIERFESFPSRYTVVDASWELRDKSAAPKLVLKCRSYADERIGNGYIELVRGQQRAVAWIADQIAIAVRRLIIEQSAVCPPP